jgi:hypothetical protein
LIRDFCSFSDILNPSIPGQSEVICEFCVCLLRLLVSLTFSRDSTHSEFTQFIFIARFPMLTELISDFYFWLNDLNEFFQKAIVK